MTTPFMVIYTSARLWRSWIAQLPMCTSTVSPLLTVLRETVAQK
jgi:hypothetical protein